MGQERRGALRKKTFLKGKVYYNHRLSSVECTIRDFTDTGARLQFAGPVTLPDNIELDIPSRDQSLTASVRWRKDNEVGLRFAEGEAERPTELPPAELGQRVVALEKEVSRLHKLVMDLRADLRHLRGDD